MIRQGKICQVGVSVCSHTKKVFGFNILC